MSELDQEVEVDAVVQPTNSVEDFINALQQQNFNRAKNHFDSLINDKVQTRLDTEKVAMAQSIFNDQDDDVEDITDEEIEDEVDAAIAEFEEEEDSEDEDTGEQEGKEIFSGAFEDEEESS